MYVFLYELIETLNDNQSIVIVDSQEKWFGNKESYFEQEKLYCWWYKVVEMYSTDEDSIWIHIIPQEKIIDDIKKRKIEEFENNYYVYLRDFDVFGVSFEDRKGVILKNIEFLERFID